MLAFGRSGIVSACRLGLGREESRHIVSDELRETAPLLVTVGLTSR